MKCRHIYLFAGLCALLLGACTGNFRDINDDLSGITDGELEADNNGLGYRLGIIQQGVYFNYDFGKGKNCRAGATTPTITCRTAGTAPCGSSPTPM